MVVHKGKGLLSGAGEHYYTYRREPDPSRCWARLDDSSATQVESFSLIDEDGVQRSRRPLPSRRVPKTAVLLFYELMHLEVDHATGPEHDGDDHDSDSDENLSRVEPPQAGSENTTSLPPSKSPPPPASPSPHSEMQTRKRSLVGGVEAGREKLPKIGKSVSFQLEYHSCSSMFSSGFMTRRLNTGGTFISVNGRAIWALSGLVGSLQRTFHPLSGLRSTRRCHYHVRTVCCQKRVSAAGWGSYRGSKIC